MKAIERVAARIKAIRQERGLSLEKFARKIAAAGYEVTQGALGHLETGRTKSIDLCLVLAISESTGLPLEEIIWPSGQLPAAPEALRESPLLRRFSDLIERMPPDELESHLRALELLADERERAGKKPGRSAAAA